LREIAQMDEVVVTLLIGKGRFFSAGADVRQTRSVPDDDHPRRIHLQRFVANNLEVTNAFYTHPKILVTALNGPAVGLSAALIGHSDFIYGTPHTYLLTPFSSLGLVAEGNSSRVFVERMGIAKAKEALIMSKRLTSEELVQCGFINKIFDVQPAEDDRFLGEVLKEIDERMGSHLNAGSMLGMKKQIQAQTQPQNDAVLLEEVLHGLNRFAQGIPQEEFMKVATGQKRHKL